MLTDIRKATQTRSGRHTLASSAFAALPLLPLVLPIHFASTDHVLWASSALYAGLAAASPRTGTALKICAVMAASILCSLALVNTGV